MGAGASEGLDKYLQRMMMEEQMAAAQQKTAADNDYRNRALEQSGEANRINRDLLQQNREATLEAGQRDDVRTSLSQLPGGTEISPETYQSAIKLRAVPPERFDNQANPDPAATSEGVPSALAQNDPSGASTIRLRKTPTEVAADSRVEDALQRADLAERSLQLQDEIGHGNLNLRGRTEDRLTSYGGPVVPTQTPDGVRNMPRGSEAVQSGTTSPPKPASERTANDELKNLLSLAEGTLKEGDANNWAGVGPIASTLGQTIRNWTGADVAGGAAGQTNRRNLGELEAFSSFSQGGKNLTATERQMMNEYLTNAKQHPTVARQNLEAAINSIKRRQEALMSGIESGGTGSGKVTRYDLDGNVVP
jgi:hypothetical protein